MFFAWWARRRRRKIWANPFPAAWLDVLQRDVGHYGLLTDPAREKLQDIVQIMLAEKSWEGCGGLILDDRQRVVIAALAGILVLGLTDFYFENVDSILVYPDTFAVPETTDLGDGTVIEDVSSRLGEAHYRGPVILSWPEVESAGMRPGQGENLVFHEFAHQLDMLNGAFDGTPNLPNRKLAQRWSVVMLREYRNLEYASRRRRPTLLDPYGTTNPAEFFAVATECFFDAPLPMKQELPELYDLFRDYYRQNPATWKWHSNEASGQDS